MLRKIIERYRLGKLAEKVTITLVDSGGAVLFHMPIMVILRHVEFMQGKAELKDLGYSAKDADWLTQLITGKVEPDVEELYFSGELKLVFQEGGYHGPK